MENRYQTWSEKAAKRYILQDNLRKNKTTFNLRRKQNEHESKKKRDCILNGNNNGGKHCSTGYGR